jgi:hypothetical protein
VAVDADQPQEPEDPELEAFRAARPSYLAGPVDHVPPSKHDPKIRPVDLPPGAQRALGRAIKQATADPWLSDRTGNPAWLMEGWQLTSHRDVVALMHFYTSESHNPEFKMERIGPVSPRYLKRKKGALAVNAMINKYGGEEAISGAEKRTALLEAVRNGKTLTQAQQFLKIRANTYAQWRKRFPEWAVEVDAARHESRLRGGTRTEPAKGKVDFTEARRHYFGYESYAHHRRIIEAIESTPPGGFTMILVPPEAGKSTLLEDWSLIRAGEDPNYRLLLCTEAGTGESSQAKKMLGSIKERMTDPDTTNPDAQYPLHIGEFLARYGPFRDAQEDKDKPWNANYIKVHRASGRRDYTIQCCGWRSKVYGSRCDDLLFDDTQSTDSLNQTEAILARMRGTFFSRPGQNGRIFYIGTRVGLGDVPERLIEAGVVDNLVIIPALDADGNSYCPEMWPEEALAQKRRLVGERAWWCNYMQDPRQAENPTFDRELLEEARNAEVKVGKVPSGQRCVLGLDPALGGFTSITATAWTPTTLQLVDHWEVPDLSRNEEIFSMVADFARRYSPGELVVEINSMQKGLARDDRMRDMARQFGFEVSEHETYQNKWQADFGVAAMAGSFIRREIIIPDGDEFSRRRMEPLLHQLEQWRPNVPAKLLRQDGVMSLWFCWRRWMEWRESSLVDAKMWEMAGTPWDENRGGVPWAGQAELSVFGSSN